ncbi:MAG: glutamate-5-semialdehyde dehydrogenase [Spirochaetota bacterium]
MESIEYIEKLSTSSKKASLALRTLPSKQKNDFLRDLAANLRKAEETLLEENQKDLITGKENQLSSALLDRLELNPVRIEKLAASVEEIANLPDPVGEIIRGNLLPNGVRLLTQRVPLGVVLVIYESRPNVTIDVGALSFKSGNACILRGGKEAIHSNLALANIFRQTLRETGLPEDALHLVEKTDRSLIIPLLQQDKYIDLVVPRGGEGLIRFVSENSRIAVVKHDKGVCNLYVDESADPKKVTDIVVNSKTHRPGVCNALENLVIHKDYPHKSELLKTLQEKGVELYLDQELLQVCPSGEEADESQYETEYLDLRLAAKQVDDLTGAIAFIQTYSSGHTEAILAENQSTIETFIGSLDSAALFVNCSTRFHDGGEFGLGAEVGISTGKLHVRGPMGLVHLTTTSTILYGNGQIRA